MILAVFPIITIKNTGYWYRGDAIIIKMCMFTLNSIHLIDYFNPNAHMTNFEGTYYLIKQIPL